MSGGNAKDFSYGDMLRDKEEVNAANIQYEETGRQSYDDDETKAVQVAGALRKQAARAKNGAVVTVKNTGSSRRPDWTVIVEVPKPKGKK
jgi:hypothetical protein